MRPQRLIDLHGQNHLKEPIELAIKAAKATNDAVGHALLIGNSGCGKTTLAQIIANERGVGFEPVIATAIKSDDDIKEILSSKINSDGYKDSPIPFDPTITKPTVLFIDEIHNLKRIIFETLYSVMEDNTYWEEKINPWSRRKQKIKTWVPRFTLIGATTREGDLDKPFLDRFRYHWRLEPYTEKECELFVLDTLRSLGFSGEDGAIKLIANRSRGVARIAIQLTRQCMDATIVSRTKILTKDMVQKYFASMKIDSLGLGEIDRKILLYLYSANRPVGINALGSYLEETKESLEKHYEPFLVIKGLVGRTPQGRCITEKGVQYLIENNLITENRKYIK